MENPDRTINEQATRIKFTNQGGIDAWNTNRYLNIWVCNLGGNTLGYAQFPFLFANTPNTDGVVILSTAFGRNGNVAAPFNTGRTATHEVGHWLNLIHIWGDANCGNDEVNDTPVQERANFGCPAFPHTTCNNGNNGDMFMNYMDYTDDACMNLFTTGQRNRMRAVLFEGARRNSDYMFFGATLPTTANARFLYGNDFRDLKSFTVNNGGILQVNGTGRSRFGNGAELNGTPVTVIPNCEMITIDIQNGGQFIIGEGQRIGTVRLGNGNTVNISAGGTLRIANSSQLVIESGSRLVISANANIDLIDANSRIVIQNGGELVINGQITFSGNGHFRFEQGNTFTLNSNLLLRGTNRNNPVIRVAEGATVQVSNPVELRIEDASIVRESGSLASQRHLWLKNGATFKANNVLFDDQTGPFNQAAFVEVDDPFDTNNDPNDVDYEFINCKFQNNSTSVKLYVPYAITDPFDWRNVNVEFRNSEFIGGQAIYADRSYITLFDNCTLTNANIDMHTSYWLNIRNTSIRGSGSGTGIKATKVGHFWFRDNSLIDQFTTGIDASQGLNWNIVMTDQATIQRCYTAIHLNGTRYDANTDLGLLHMDCARLIQNVNGIKGTDIIFSAYTRWNVNGETSNIFTKNTDDPSGLHIESLFQNRWNETDVWLHGNYWNGTTPPTTVINSDWSFRMKRVPQYTEPWNGTIHIDPVRTGSFDPAVQNCGGISLRNDPNDPLSNRTIVNINGILRDVKIQQDAGWRKLSQSSLKDAVALLLPVANLSNNITDTASRTVNHLVDVAKAFTLSTGVQPRSASTNDGWLPETIIGIVKQNNSFTIQPNPVSDQFEIVLPIGSYEITVFDALGRVVLKQDTEGVSKVNVRNWQNGIYLVNLLDKTTKVKQHSKVVVQH